MTTAHGPAMCGIRLSRLSRSGFAQADVAAVAAPVADVAVVGLNVATWLR
jgi:hypothetical protein